MVKYLRYISFILICLLSLEVVNSLNVCQDQYVVLETKTQENCRDCLHVVRSEILTYELILNFGSRMIQSDELKQTTMMLNSFVSEKFRPPNQLIAS